MPQLEGLPHVYGIHPHETSEDQKHDLGTKGISADGRVYRYAQNGDVAIGPGLLCVAPDITALHEDIVVSTVAIGGTTIVVAAGAAVVAGEYEEGFLNLTDGTAQGIMYAIANCPAIAAAGNVTIRLAEPIRVATITGDTTGTLYRNKYRFLRVSDVDQIDMPVGVMNVTLPIDYYGWLQVKGPCSILTDSTDTTPGEYITNGDTEAGAVETWTVADPIVGIQPIGNNADIGEYGSYELMLDY